MKKVEENRYPHSATLFRFCKEALALRFDGNVKVIDQDVGALLGYDPADCSHWKKGKKSIKALATIRTLSEQLQADERLLCDIAAGRVGLDEAIFEYRGYGSFALEGKNLDNLKKEFFKNPLRWESEDYRASFEELFDPHREEIQKMVDRVLSATRIEEAPVYLPELLGQFSMFHVEVDQNLNADFIVEAAEDSSRVVIQHRAADVRPYVRFRVARELFRHLVKSGHEFGQYFQKAPTEILEVQSNLFAVYLLMPAALLRREVERTNHAFDIIAQLADTFWVSKTIVNQRLKEYLEFGY